MGNLNTGSWPTATLIRIVRGEVNGVPVRDALAACDPIYPSSCTIATGEESGELIVRGEAGDRIEQWEGPVPVPAAALAGLQGAFEGMDGHSPARPPARSPARSLARPPALPEEGLSGPQIAAVRAILACLPES